MYENYRMIITMEDIKDISLSRFSPYDGDYLEKHLSKVPLQEKMIAKLNNYLATGLECAASLDEVYCLGMQLGNCDFVKFIGEQKLDEIFNTQVNDYSEPRVRVFIEGLGSRYTGRFSNPKPS